ncbi:amine oxidase [Plakobranchus ocellatus]|uniref:monoamine oxidase n=1 Tax=Plakobranchus ocellatus TaxID=259542 RepID=A0AAV4B8H5_9GAST|nr:amine oxidase [Plakobranchus ocellatus]
MRRYAVNWLMVAPPVAFALLISLKPCLGKPTGKGCSETVDVAIVGGGIGGAYSAYNLRDKSLKIGVYEYSDRLGGRLYTEHLANVPDQNIELGGMRFIKTAHTRLYRLIKDLNLKTEVLLNADSDSYESRVFRRNVSMTSSEYKTGHVPFNLTQEENDNQADLLRYVFSKLTNDSLKNLTEERLFQLTVPDGRKLYQLSVVEALNLTASSEAKSYLLLENHFNSAEIAATDMVYYYFGSHGPQQGGLRLSGPPSGQGAGSGARTRDRRVPADLRADSQATVLSTPQH